MFLKKKKAGGHVYWDIVESVKVPGKGPRHTLLMKLGRVEEHVARALFDAYKLAHDTGGEVLVFSPYEMTTGQPLHHGAFEVLQHLWDHLCIPEHFLDRHGECNGKHSCTKMGFLLMCYVLFTARERSHSKKRIADWYTRTTLPRLLGIPVDDLYDNRFYRSMDHLLDVSGSLPRHLFEKALEEGLTSKDYVFYDLTSTYFEGDKGEITKKGYARDNRPDRKQVNWSLSMSREGFPIAFDIFPGNRVDSKTVSPFLGTLKERHGIEHAVFVGDRGMSTEANINACLRHGHKYILGYRFDWACNDFLGDLSIEDITDWEELPSGLKISEKSIRRPRGRSRYILCRNEENVARDVERRTRKFEKVDAGLEKIRDRVRRGQPSRRDKVMVDVGKFLGDQNARRFYDVSAPAGDTISDLTWTLDEEAVAKVAQLDGCFVIRTNVWDLPGAEIVATYKRLQTVENAFKSIKSVLEVRPVRHRIEDRIQIHILLYVLAQSMLTYLKRRCEANGLDIVPERVLDSLYDVFLERIDMGKPTGQVIETISTISRDDKKFLKMLGMEGIGSSLVLS